MTEAYRVCETSTLPEKRITRARLPAPDAHLPNQGLPTPRRVPISAREARASEPTSSPIHLLGIQFAAHESTSAFSMDLTGMLLAQLIGIEDEYKSPRNFILRCTTDLASILNGKAPQRNSPSSGAY